MHDVIDRTWGWNADWQRREFERRFASCIVSVIECDGRAVGGLMLSAEPGVLEIIELQIHPDEQRRGIGSFVIEEVTAEGARRGVPVTLSVVEANPGAQRLYQRLGFEVAGLEEPFIRMRRRPLRRP
ncbi:MAG: GNAT family N-acetyltransferase [Deltaproteobacteria bacterium]|nr:GNAT family N-acetyltransferase [Deltaproteobacteria bacterium]